MIPIPVFSDSDKKKIALIVLGCVLFLFIEFRFFLRAQFQRIRKAQAEITQLKKQIDDFNSDLSVIRSSQEKPLKAGTAASKIISEIEYISLLQDISGIANKYDIKIIQIKLIKEAQGVRAQKAGTEIPATKPVLITLTGICDYHSLGTFISDVENSEILIVVQEIKITPQETDSLKQKFNLILKTYVK